MTILLIISSMAFLISFGSWARFERERVEKGVHMNVSAFNGLLPLFFPLFSFLMLNLTLNKLLDIKWYLIFVIAFFAMPFIGNPLTEIYCDMFGIKRTKEIDLRTLEMNTKRNEYILDSIITFSVGFVLYLVALLF